MENKITENGDASNIESVDDGKIDRFYKFLRRIEAQVEPVEIDWTKLPGYPSECPRPARLQCDLSTAIDWCDMALHHLRCIQTIVERLDNMSPEDRAEAFEHLHDELADNEYMLALGQSFELLRDIAKDIHDHVEQIRTAEVTS